MSGRSWTFGATGEKRRYNTRFILFRTQPKTGRELLEPAEEPMTSGNTHEPPNEAGLGFVSSLDTNVEPYLQILQQRMTSPPVWTETLLPLTTADLTTRSHDLRPPSSSIHIASQKTSVQLSSASEHELPVWVQFLCCLPSGPSYKSSLLAKRWLKIDPDLQAESGGSVLKFVQGQQPSQMSVCCLNLSSKGIKSGVDEKCRSYHSFISPVPINESGIPPSYEMFSTVSLSSSTASGCD